MSNITTLKVRNKSDESDNEEFVIYTDWSDTKIQVLILKCDNTMLVGEAIQENFNAYAKTFEKPLEVYLQETRDILTGENKDVEFYLKDNKCYWKQKMWALGEFIVGPTVNINCLAKFSWNLIDNNSKVKKEAIDVENLKNENFVLRDKLNEIINLKDQIESGLYKKFILVVNSKKSKIRELASNLKKFISNEDPIFDAITDESETESELKDNLYSHSTHVKNKFEYTESEGVNVNHETTEKKSECKIDERTTESVSEYEVVNQPSTSKDASSIASNAIEEDEETPDFLSYESECELVLKLEEEKFENVSKSKKSTITDEESEEEMF